MTINCIIIDDEPLARKGLKEYIGDIDFLHLLGDFDTPLKISEILNTNEVHLLLLDIQMPKITGLNWLKSLQNHPQVIITTAYPQYALEGFDLDVLDYLVKPISFDRFFKAALKAKEYFSLRYKNNEPPTKDADQNHFFIKSENKLVKILYDDILFVEALQNYVCIQTVNHKYITYLTFKSVEEYLPGDRFIKTHKSYIIAAAKTESIEGNEIFIGKYRIPVSRNYKEEVLEKLVNGKYLKR